MKLQSLFKSKGIFLLISCLTLTLQGFSQEIVPYSYSLYQKLNSTLYSKDTRFHTSMRPITGADSVLINKIDSILSSGTERTRNSWAARKLFNEHLIQLTGDDYSFYADFLPDFQIGRDQSGKTTTWLNTRGYQVGGSIGKKFSFYTSGFENQGRFAKYMDEYITSTGIVPGQSYNRQTSGLTRDWSYVTALINYNVNKHLSVTVGHDKNFIGDGYRSMLMSDFSSPLSFLKLTGTLGNVRYTAMWTAMDDPGALKLSYDAGNRKKGGVFHFLDWNVNNRLSFGFFDAVIWGQVDDLGNKRGFNWAYANPIIFLRPLEASSGSPDNALLGLTSKYKFDKQLVLYAQVAVDELRGKEIFAGKGSFTNKTGWQVGLKGADVLNVPRLNYLIEYNSTRPYTYSGRTRIISYTNYGEPLAHPYGSNFKEFLGILNYTYKRFDFSTQLQYATYGLDANGQNNGKNILLPYTFNFKEYGNYIAQGIKTNLIYSESKVAFVLNPKYNLRLEAGGIFRRESNSLGTKNAAVFTFGLRSSFRNLYSDF